MKKQKRKKLIDFMIREYEEKIKELNKTNDWEKIALIVGYQQGLENILEYLEYDMDKLHEMFY